MEHVANELVVWIAVTTSESHGGGGDVIVGRGIVAHGDDVIAASVEGVDCGSMTIGAMM
jgi:hypothetical protein